MADGPQGQPIKVILCKAQRYPSFLIYPYCPGPSSSLRITWLKTKVHSSVSQWGEISPSTEHWALSGDMDCHNGHLGRGQGCCCTPHNAQPPPQRIIWPGMPPAPRLSNPAFPYTSFEASTCADGPKWRAAFLILLDWLKIFPYYKNNMYLCQKGKLRKSK